MKTDERNAAARVLAACAIGLLSASAAARPAGPAPTTATSHAISFRVRAERAGSQGWSVSGVDMEELFGAGGEVGRVELALEVGEIRGLGDEAREGGGVDARDDARASTEKSATAEATGGACRGANQTLRLGGFGKPGADAGEEGGGVGGDGDLGGGVAGAEGLLRPFVFVGGGGGIQPAAASTVVRARQPPQTRRRPGGTARTVRTGRPSRPRNATSIGNLIPTVWTARQRGKAIASPGARPSRPSSPRIRSRARSAHRQRVTGGSPSISSGVVRMAARVPHPAPRRQAAGTTRTARWDAWSVFDRI